MRIALVSHQFPPDSNAGTEIVTLRLAHSLAARGHEVLVHTTRKDLTRQDGELVRESYEGLQVQRLIRNLFHRDFRDTFEDPSAEAAFARTVLEEFQPELVHVHHLLHHSLGLPRLAAEAGVPVVMTLHDYWLECPKFGHLRGWDEEICHEVVHERCSRCLQAFAWRNPQKLAWFAGALRRVRQLTRLDVQRPFQRLWRRLSTARDVELGGERHEAPNVDPALVQRMDARRRAVLEVLVPHVRRFLCPSEFLRGRMLALGLPEERTETKLFGVPRPGPEFARRESPDAVRFAFVGSVLPHKGAHVLVEAFELLQREFGEKVFLKIHGGWSSDPGYGERVRDLALELGAAVPGAFPPEELESVLSEVDVLVVPSVWFENSPVTIHDAHVRGIPVLCSDLGAMRELVPDPARRFRPADPEDLARAMRAFVVGEAREGVGPLPPSPEEALENLLQLYGSLCR